MPYKLRKAPKRDLYWVVSTETGMKHSKEPIPKAKAEAQMRILIAAMNKNPESHRGGMNSNYTPPMPSVVDAVEASRKGNKTQLTDDEFLSMWELRREYGELPTPENANQFIIQLRIHTNMEDRRNAQGQRIADARQYNWRLNRPRMISLLNYYFPPRGGAKAAVASAQPPPPPPPKKNQLNDHYSHYVPALTEKGKRNIRALIGRVPIPEVAELQRMREQLNRELPPNIMGLRREIAIDNDPRIRLIQERLARRMEMSREERRPQRVQIDWSGYSTPSNLEPDDDYNSYAPTATSRSGTVRSLPLTPNNEENSDNEGRGKYRGGFYYLSKDDTKRARKRVDETNSGASVITNEVNELYNVVKFIRNSLQNTVNTIAGEVDAGDQGIIAEIQELLSRPATFSNPPLNSEWLEYWMDINILLDDLEHDDDDDSVGMEEGVEGMGTHRQNFFKSNKIADKSYSLKELAKISAVPMKKLQMVYNRGIGAYKTNPSSVRLKGSYVKGVNAPMKKKLSKEQWAMARVYSFLDGNPKHDNDLRGGAWYDVFNPNKVINEIVNPDSIARRRVSDVFKGIRTNLPPSARRTMEQYGNEVIQSLIIRRDPIQSALNKAFELITLGQWSKAKSAEHYDDLFHLGLVLTLKSGKQILVEKNEVINIGNPKPLQKNSQTLNLPSLLTPTTLNQFIANGVAVKGDDFYRYDPFANNCQDFVAVLLQANKNYPPQAVTFVKQPVENLLKKLPQWTQPIAKGITDLGAIANVALEGGGHSKFMSQLRKAGLNPSVYLKNAQKKAKDAGYGNGAKLLGFATDGIHKLAMPNEDGKLILFGRVGYGDHLIWSHLEKTKQTPQGTASKKQNVFQKSHSKIKGDWKADPFSPNNLALKILW